MTSPEQRLAELSARAETTQRNYQRALGDIHAKKTQLEDAMTELRNLGATSLDHARTLIADLETKINNDLAEIDQLLT